MWKADFGFIGQIILKAPEMCTLTLGEYLRILRKKENI